MVFLKEIPGADEYLREVSEDKEELINKFYDILIKI